MLTKLIRSTQKQPILLHLFVVFLILFVLLIRPALADQGGPDNFGYIYVDSDEAGGSCNPTFTDISATGTPLNLADEARTNVTMPFSFTFYGVSSDRLRVGNNGGILFNTTTGNLPPNNQALPAGNLSFPAILPFWDNLGDAAGNVFVQSLGTAPNRRYIVQWHDRPHVNGGGNVTFQTVLYEGTTNIDFIYQDVIFGGANFDGGANATVGLRQDTTNALQYSFNTAALTNGLAICFRLQQVEMAVLDGSTEIPNNIGSVDFGATPLGTPITKTFTISNSGSTDLNLTGSPLVTITGPAAAEFSLVVSPTTPINPNNTTTFQVRFDPTLVGTRPATVTIANNDANENPYTFAIQGEGVGVPAITLEKTVGTDPSVCAPTNDLTLPGGSDVTYCYTVRNTGSLTLTHHTLEDDQLGALQSDFLFILEPGQSTFLTATTTITQTTLNTVVWTAFNPGPTDVVTATASATVTVPLPDITISGNGQIITPGDISPSPADGTDFGSVTLGQGVIRTFIISNTGLADLNLTGSPLVTITGAAASDFSLVTAPTTPISPDNLTTFQISFDPGALGNRTATLTIASDDPDENPYTFDIQGTGVSAPPDIALSGNGQAITTGDTSPSTADGTDFGSITFGQALTQTFTISNTGEADLNLTGLPLVTITGAAAADFSLVASPTTPIISGGATTFQVSFNPSTAGIRAAMLTIANDDPDENPYTFAIQGTGVLTQVDSSSIYLPFISKESIPVADLIVDSLAVSSSAITITIRNAGTATVVDAFWVDVYFNPTQTPGINQPWDVIAPAGAVWGVTETVDPNEVLTLTTGGPYYFAGESSALPFPAGAQVFALVDSVNPDTTYGNVQEGDEANNLFGPVTSVAAKDSGVKINLEMGSPSQEGLPKR